MDQSKLLEKLGRKQALLEDQDVAYDALLNVLCGILLGVIDLSQVMVNRTTRTWEVAPKGQRPALPATINGLPVCVIAPEKET